MFCKTSFVYSSIKERKIKVMKTLNISERYNHNHGIIHEIIEYNGFKFKIVAKLTNGSNELYAEKMDKDGIFKFVLGKLDLDFEFRASYVSSESNKQADLKTGIDKMKVLIKKIY